MVTARRTAAIAGSLPRTTAAMNNSGHFWELCAKGSGFTMGS